LNASENIFSSIIITFVPDGNFSSLNSGRNIARRGDQTLSIKLVTRCKYIST